MNEAATESNHKRRWYQCSMRSLWIFMLAGSLLVFGVGYKALEAKKQKESVAWVKGEGGSINYDYRCSNGKWIPQAQPPGPDWLREWVGIDLLCDVTEVNLSGTKISDLAELKGLKDLEVLALDSTSVSDLSPLASLTNLIELRLSDTRVNDLSSLTGMTKLRGLDLSGTPVTNNDVQQLQKTLPRCYISWDGEFDKDIEACNKAIELNPKDSDAYIRRGNFWILLRDYDKAIADYSEAIRLNPNDTEGYYRRQIALEHKGDQEAAGADFQKAEKLKAEQKKLKE